MRKMVKRLIAVGLGAVAVTATTQGPAAAGEVDYPSTYSRYYYSCPPLSWEADKGPAGWASFNDRGETFLVRDLCSDKRDIRVRWKYRDSDGTWPSAWRYIHYTGGGEEEYDFDLPERGKVYFQVGLEDDGDYVSGSYGFGTSWTTGEG